MILLWKLLQKKRQKKFQPEDNKITEDPIEEPKEEQPPVEEQKEKPVVQEEKPAEPESRPKQVDRLESDKNGVRRKKLYIAFIEVV